MNIGMTKAIATQAAKDEIAKVGTGVDNVARTGVNEVKSQLDEKASKNELLNKTDKIYVDNKVATISSGTPLFASSVAGMTDTTKNYVNTTDGFLYTYNGATFVKSNVQYQSTGINDESISLSKTTSDISLEILKQIAIADKNTLYSTEKYGLAFTNDESSNNANAGFFRNVSVSESYDIVGDKINYIIRNNIQTVHEFVLTKSQFSTIKNNGGLTVNYTINTETSVFPQLILRFVGVRANESINIFKDVTVNTNIPINTKLLINNYLSSNEIPQDIVNLRIYLRVGTNTNNGTTASIENFSLCYGSINNGLNMTLLKKQAIDIYTEALKINNILDRLKALEGNTMNESNNLELKSYIVDKTITHTFAQPVKKIFIQNEDESHDVLFSINDDVNIFTVSPKIRMDIIAGSITKVTIKPNTFVANIIIGGSY